MRRTVSKIAAVSCVIWLALLHLGCDASRTNPLDPLGEGFEESGSVTGRVTTFYEPFAPMEGIEVRIEPGRRSVGTGVDGLFEFRGLLPGAYHVTVAEEAWAARPETLDVRRGVTVEVVVRLDALPDVDRLAYHSVHISRWWPEEDLLLLEVDTDVSDRDGPADLDKVWIEAPSHSYVDTLRATQVSGRFELVRSQIEMPMRSLDALIGIPLELHASDRAGFSTIIRDRGLVRVIRETPQTQSPQDLVVTPTNTPTLTWLPLQLPFSFTYRIDVVRVEANVETIVLQIPGVSPATTSIVTPQALAPGTYYWVVWVVDQFGNRSRSKQAGFRIS